MLPKVSTTIRAGTETGHPRRRLPGEGGRKGGDGGKDLVEAVNFLAELAGTDIYAPARKADVP